MDKNIKEIGKIVFGIYSPEEIRNMAVCKVHTTKLSGNGSVYDEKMGGNIDMNRTCVTCKMPPKECPGHFGYIELNEYIIHPLYYKIVVSYLNSFCVNCFKLLISKDHLILSGLMKEKGEHRFEKILNKLEKVDMCCHCSYPQPKYMYNNVENSIIKIYKEKGTYIDENGKKKDIKTSINVDVNDIKRIFDNITDEDVKLCGFDPKLVKPGNLILSTLPVIPPSTRPFVIVDGNMCDDDLTNQLIEIIKANNILREDTDPQKEKKTKYYQKTESSPNSQISYFHFI